LRNLFLICLAVFTRHHSLPEWKAYHLSGFAQGSTYQVTYYAKDSLVTQSEIDNKLANIDSSFSLYKPYSLISNFNRAQMGMVINQDFATVVRTSIDINRDTHGLFDITVAPLMEAWGFRGKPAAILPDEQTIRSILPCIGTNRIALKSDSLVKEKACVEIDLDGIAQGYSVDLLAGILEKKGIKNYLVELGGEIRVLGRKQPSGEMMSIGIEAPEENDFLPSKLRKIIRVDEGAVTTSGSYRQYRESGGKKLMHLINPLTGYPATTDLVSVTVWARDAITADGYDNSLMLMGRDGALQFLSGKAGMEAYLIYKKQDGTIADTATKGFYTLFRNQIF
jgi:thiamine biosynthesis lipoprotein